MATLFLMSSSLNQNNPKPKYQCNSELICIRDFEAIQKIHLEFLNLTICRCSFFKQYMINVQCTLVPHCGQTLIFCRSFKLIIYHCISSSYLIPCCSNDSVRVFKTTCLDTRQPGTVFKKLDTRQSEILTNFLEIARLIPLRT